ALVSRIVCAVGLCEALAAPRVLPALPLLFALLEPLVLLEPPAFVPALCFPEDAPEDAPAAGFLFVAGFFVCSVAVVEFCLPLATPSGTHTAIIPIMEATAAAPRSLLQALVTVVSFFQPTLFTLTAFQNPNSSIQPRTSADNSFAFSLPFPFL